MFRFNRDLILPLFLKKRMTIAQFAREAGVSHASAQRAIEGERVSAIITGRIAGALGIDAATYLEPSGREGQN